MNVLVACERSGIVREAFRKLGHYAWSCDLLESEDKSQYHIKGDVLDELDGRWDLMIAHPPCQHLAVSGARWFKDKQIEQKEALNFIKELMDTNIARVCIENPVSIISSRIRKPDQIIQPWEFGHEETKTTCLWLKNLPKLISTKIMEKRDRNLTPSGQNKLGPSPERAYLRAKTYPGIAEAMAKQWSNIKVVQTTIDRNCST